MLSERTRDGAPPLTLGLEPDRERVIVRPAGEIDIATIDALQDEVAELMGRGFDQLVLDLRALTFIDSGGVRYVAELARELGDGLTVVPGPPEVQRAFVVLGLDQRIRFAKPRRFMRRP